MRSNKESRNKTIFLIVKLLEYEKEKIPTINATLRNSDIAMIITYKI